MNLSNFFRTLGCLIVNQSYSSDLLLIESFFFFFLAEKIVGGEFHRPSSRSVREKRTTTRKRLDDGLEIGNTEMMDKKLNNQT